jgi:hypothetical protein
VLVHGLFQLRRYAQLCPAAAWCHAGIAGSGRGAHIPSTQLQHPRGAAAPRTLGVLSSISAKTHAVVSDQSCCEIMSLRGLTAVWDLSMTDEL